MIEPKNALATLVAILERVPPRQWQSLPTEQVKRDSHATIEGFRLEIDELEIIVQSVHLKPGAGILAGGELLIIGKKGGRSSIRYGNFHSLYMGIVMGKPMTSENAPEQTKQPNPDDVSAVEEIYEILSR